MTTAVTPTSSPTDAAASLLAKLRDVNAANALIAANAMTPIVERLAIEGAATPDLELARKMLESLQKVAVHPEKQESAKATATAAAAILQIVLDDNIPQVAPPKRKRIAQDVEDAIEVPIEALVDPASAPAAELPPHADPALEDLTWGTDL